MHTIITGSVLRLLHLLVQILPRFSLYLTFYMNDNTPYLLFVPVALATRSLIRLVLNSMIYRLFPIHKIEIFLYLMSRRWQK